MYIYTYVQHVDRCLSAEAGCPIVKLKGSNTYQHVDFKRHSHGGFPKWDATPTWMVYSGQSYQNG